MALAGISPYRRMISREVRHAISQYGLPPADHDVDVSIFEGLEPNAHFVDASEHRRLAYEARAELWRAIRRGDVINAEEGDESEPTEAVQVFEEMSHTE
jgi:hypothetical protein